MARASPILLLVVVLVTAGCVQPPPEHPPAGKNEPAPIQGVHRMSLDVNGFVVQYLAPGAPEDELLWHATDEARWDAGTFILPVTMTSDGMTLFAFTLRFRLDEPHPVQLAFNDTLALTNTFNFTFFEHASWAGRDANLTRAVDVSEDSWLDVHTWERHKARLSGDFRVEFEATSADGSVTERVILNGSFPIPRGH